MFSKFSVKKPYTVMVGIVLVLILGFVSFTNMTTDLFPDITLPYAMVMTSYPGASPEEVEMMVSKPVEQAMATVNNVENIQSISSENMSVVMMEFSQNTNMDSASLEMREGLDQIRSFLDDGVGDPMIIKMNPDMMPVMVAAIELKDSDSVELTNIVEKNILNELESLEGVASVMTSGGVKENVSVVLDQDKIDKVNEDILKALDLSFSEGREELAQGREEMEKAENSLNQMEQQMDQGTDELAGQLGNVQAELQNKKDELLKTEIDLDNKLSQLEEGIKLLDLTEKELNAQEENLNKAEEALNNQPVNLESLKNQREGLQKQADLIHVVLESGLPSEYEEKTGQLLNEQQILLQMQSDENSSQEDIQLQQEKIQLLEQSITEISQKIDGLMGKNPSAEGAENNPEKTAVYTQSGLTAQKTALEANIQLLDGSIQKLEEVQNGEMNPESIKEAREELNKAKEELAVNRSAMEEGKKQIILAKDQIAGGKLTLDEAVSQLNSQQITGTIEMAAAQANLALGKNKLEESRSKVESGEEKLDQMEDQAREESDMKGKITPELISQILVAQNFRMPAGYVEEDGIKYLIRVGDKFHTVEDLENLVLFDLGLEGVDPITLSMVSDVSVADNSSQVYAKINGHPGILLTIQKQTGYSTGDVSDRLREKFDEFSRDYQGMRVIPLMDQGIYIHMVVNSVLQNLLSGAVLAILILFVFLKDIRPTAVVACSIPVSVLGAVVLMYFSGISLNVISLSGLALGVGMLVDNSIVVIENIYRLRSLGVPIKKAAIQGAQQVAAAITSSTLTTVCVFLPIVFTKGITRQLFVDMGLTIGYSLLASLVIALSLVPAMAAGSLKKDKKISHPLLDRMNRGYGKIMEKLLHRKALVLLGALILLVASGMLIAKRGAEFMPAMESTQASISIELPEGSSIEETGAMADQIMERLGSMEDIVEMGAMAGGDTLMGKAENNQASIYIILSEDKKLSESEFTKEVQKKTEDLDCKVEVTANQMDMSALGGSGIQVRIMGKEMDTLEKTGEDIKNILEGIKGLEEVSDGMEKFSQEMRLTVDKEKASSYNLTTAQVFQQVQQKIKDQGDATTLSTESKDYPVNVTDGRKKEYTRENVKEFVLEGTDKEGNKVDVPLKDIAVFEMAKSADSINRLNQTRFLTVSAQVKEGYNIGLAGNDVKKALEKYQMPEGYSYKMAGEDETIQSSMIEVVKMLLLAIVFIYLIMVAQFQSLLSPFIVMFTVPLAFTGGFLGLLFTGETMSIVAMIGFVMLSGIIVNNGIVLVDYMNQLQAEGMERHQAIIEAGKTRMRPILMTALTTVLGLSTMSMGIGMGSDMVQSMAVVTTGGLLYGTLLTLFVVPCVYDILNHKKYKKEDEGLLLENGQEDPE